MKKLVFEYLKPKSKEQVLDFGCGTGTGILFLKENFPEVLISGYDVDSKIIAIARAKLSKVESEIITGEGNMLPFGDASFDKVYSTWVFHHLYLDEKKQALDEINRVLKPNGTFVLGDWGVPRGTLMRILFSIVQFFDITETTNHSKDGTLDTLLKNSRFKSCEVLSKRNTIFGTFYYWVLKN